jgi:UDP-glucose 4-epimerase
MNILISGGSGYIGSKLIKEFIKDNIFPDIISRKDLSYSQYPQIKIYQADITSPLTFVPEKQYDIFIHLAAANDIDSSNHQTALLSTTLGTRHCLDFCAKYSIRKFLYFSTFQVYGKVEGIMNEQTPCLPSNEYGITHFFAEEYVKLYNKSHRINYLIVRPTNIYGSPVSRNIDRWSLVPNCFCKEAYEKQSITLESSGRQCRDFISLQDLVEVTKTLCNRFPEFQNTIMNISSGNKFTILEIAEAVKQQYEKQFSEKCELIIKSKEPCESNKFDIDSTYINNLKHSFREKDYLYTEVNNIFNLIRT